MFVAQGESGVAVIKFRLTPRFLVMASATFVAEFAVVRLVLAMTVDAAMRRIAILLSGLVAGTAVDERMLSVKRVIRVVVLECDGAQMHDVCFTSQMFAVTRP